MAFAEAKFSSECFGYIDVVASPSVFYNFSNFFFHLLMLSRYPCSEHTIEHTMVCSCKTKRPNSDYAVGIDTWGKLAPGTQEGSTRSTVQEFQGVSSAKILSQTDSHTLRE